MMFFPDMIEGLNRPYTKVTFPVIKKTYGPIPSSTKEEFDANIISLAEGLVRHWNQMITAWEQRQQESDHESK